MNARGKGVGIELGWAVGVGEMGLVNAIMKTLRGMVTALPLLVLTISASLAADCVEDRRTVKFADGQLTKLRSYRCEIGGAKLNVEFHRLSDVASSLVLNNKKFAEVAQLVSDARIGESVVAANFIGMLAKGYDVRDFRDNEGSISVSAPGQEVYYGNTKAPRNSIEFRKLSWSGEYIEMPAPAAAARSLSDGMMPQGYFFYSYSYDSGPASAPEIWRYLTAQDIADYGENLKRYVEYFKLPGDFTAEYRGPPKVLTDFAKVIGGKIPPGLVSMHLRVASDGCGESYSSDWIDRQLYFADIFMPQVIVDTILIQNRSANSVSIDDLLGDRDQSKGLREYKAGDRRRMDKTGLGRYRLAAGESLLVPLGIALVGSGNESPSNPSAKQKAYAARIARQFKTSEKNYREPMSRRFAFGEQYAVNGLSVNGRPVALAGRSSNYTAIEIDLEGSCPYLSTLRAGGEWVERGKVLHKSNAPELEARETYSYDGFIERIRLDEREAERAVLRSVEARMLLIDGRDLPLRVRDGATGADVGEFALNWGDSREMRLQLPDGIREGDVMSTEIVVQGYYERYATLAAAKAQRAIEGVPATAWRPTVVQCSMPTLMR